MSRLHKTLADYLVIAVSPAMIMVLIGSLVFFLVDVFYGGQHQERLDFVLACFIVAAVLIGRIAIEIGKEHAMMYAAPLALVTAMALDRFVELHGRAAPYALPINLGLMALVWYCAHKLTWDCTMVDESQDASGEGLLEHLGLERGKQVDGQSRPSPEPSSPHPNPLPKGEGTTAASRESPRPRPSHRPNGVRTAAASPEKSPLHFGPPPEGEGMTGDYRPRPWWERLIKPPPRAHSPGASVVWFSLAALAMFGVGQRFIPAADADRRRRALVLLAVFAACALGLLLTTSFLGLRRYLRQRRLEMPGAMAAAWIAVGGSLVGAVLALALLLPRPSPEFAVSEVPWRTTSPEHGSSPYAVGRDAAEKEANESGKGESGKGESGKGESGKG